MEQVLKIKKMRPGAEVPQRATEGAAGLDLRACIDAPVTLAPGGLAMIPSGMGSGSSTATTGEKSVWVCATWEPSPMRSSLENG